MRDEMWEPLNLQVPFAGASHRRLRLATGFAKAAGAGGIGLGVAVLTGWAFDVSLLKGVLPGMATMKANTALGFIACGLSLFLRTRVEPSAGGRRLADALAALGATLGLLTLAEYATGAGFGVDDLLFLDRGGPPSPTPPGRMSPMTAFGFVLVGGALLLLDRRRRLAGILAGITALLSSVALAGYLYGVSSLYSVVGYGSVALHTAVGLLFLSAGMACARPKRRFMRVLLSDTAGGLMARRLLPAALLVPPLFGLMRLAGQQADLDDTRVGVTLFAISNVLVFLGLVAWSASTLFRVDMERRAALESLKANEARLRLMVEHTPAAIAMLDRDMRYVLVNPRWMSDFSLGDRDLVGLSHYEVFPEVPERWREVHRRCLAGAVEVCEEDSFVRADGSVEWLRWEVLPWRDRRGEIGGIVIFAELTTARKRAEEALRKSEEGLRQAQRMEAVGRLAGGVAHDFNNLLTVINGYGELLQAAMPNEEPCRESVREIVAAGKRAAGLTRQLLAFSRKQVLDPRVVNLNEVLAGMETMIRRLIGEDIEFVALFARDLGCVVADPGQMEQVVMNLAVNARDAMPRGGRLTLETKNVSLDGEYATGHGEVRAGPHVMLAVSDTGTGMDAETRARAFEPFFTTKEAGKGTGLGLSTVYGIVKQSGGHIWVYSEPDHGATFRIFLPCVEGDARPSRPLPAVVTKLDGTENILVVEDDEALRRYMTEVLAARGYQVLLAKEGQEALSIARVHSGEIHLLVTDVIMPGMSGRAAAEEIRAARPATKVLYISGYTDNAIVHHGRLDEGVEFLAKPFGPEALARKVRAVLDAPNEP